MKNSIRKILMVILIAVFVVSTALSLRQKKDNAGGAAAYEAAANIAMQQKTDTPEPIQPSAIPPEHEDKNTVSCWVAAPVEGDPVMEEMKRINLGALRETNPDVVGWIRIPDTQIDYPLLQGEDNEFYLDHTWEKEPNSVGSIFLEWQNSADLTDYNTIVYGHNMNDGSMFAELELFNSQAHWETHPYVYISSDVGVYRYEIFSFWQPEVESLAYGMNPEREDTKEKFLDLSLENSRIDTGIRPAVTDRILTLSTCSGGGYTHRYVVQARLPMLEVVQ